VIGEDVGGPPQSDRDQGEERGDDAGDQEQAE